MVTVPRGMPSPGAGSGDPRLSDRVPVPYRRPGIPVFGLLILVVALAAAAKGVWLVFEPDLAAVNGGSPGAFGEGERIDGRSRSSVPEHLAPGPAGIRSPGSASTSPPGLALLGVILPGYALISVNGRPQRAFMIGQEIIAGLFLRAIYRDRVLVERDGKQELLILKDRDGRTSAALTVPGGQPGGRWVAAPRPEDFPGVESIGKDQYRVSRDHVNAQMRNPEILADARLDPYPGGGFVVNGIKPGSVYEKLGLKPGDVIQSVNGTAVNSAADAVRLYQQLYQFNQVRLGVVRGGQLMQLSYNLH